MSVFKELPTSQGGTDKEQPAPEPQGLDKYDIYTDEWYAFKSGHRAGKKNGRELTAAKYADLLEWATKFYKDCEESAIEFDGFMHTDAQELGRILAALENKT